jgi:tetratricopeptide (TPR) repeat protein
VSAVALVAALLGSASGVWHDLSLEDWAREYQTGDAGRAVRNVASWTPDRRTAEIKGLPVIEAPWTRAALALLLTESGFANESFGQSTPTADLLVSPLEIGTRTATDIVLDLQDRARADSDAELGLFCRGWFIVATSVRMRHGHGPSMPLDYGPRFRGDAELQLLLGAVLGPIGPYKVGGPVNGPMPLRLIAVRRSVASELIETSHGQFWRQEVREVELSLRSALRIDPDLVEARLRLGHLLNLMDRRKDAQAELDRAIALASATGDRFSGHMAGLVLGGLHEDDGRVAEAEAAYRAARAFELPGHSADVALGTLLVSQGRAAEGWRVIRTVFAGIAAEPPRVDPWISFRTAFFWRVDDWWPRLRALVRRMPAPPALPTRTVARADDPPPSSTAPSVAQPPPTGGQPPRFRSGVDGVRLDVRVQADGRAIERLVAEDFELKDNGVIQEVTLQQVPARVAAAFVIDRSPSVTKILPDLTAAARMFAEALEPTDLASVVTFSDRLELLAIGERPQRLSRVIVFGPEPMTRTTMRDAVMAGASLVAEDAGYPLVVVFGDAMENASWLEARAATNALSRAGVTVDAVWGKGDWSFDGDSVTGVHPKDEYVKPTGGVVFDVNAPDLRGRFRSESPRSVPLRADLCRPASPGDGWHKVSACERGGA